MPNSRALIVSSNIESREQWAEDLKSGDWQVSCVASRDDALAAIPDFLPVLMLLDIQAEEHASEVDEHFAQRCRDSGLAVIVVFADPTPEDIAVSFRRGAIDVLIEPFNRSELFQAIARAGDFKDLYQENMDYRGQLERANRELQDSLNILRMDQMAGHQVQLNLLPTGPLKLGEYTASHRIVPSLFLSGDFVGYSVAFDRFLLFYVADVSGHGASSAFVTIMLSYIIRQIIRRHINEGEPSALLNAPEGLIEHVNRHIMALELDKHLTIFAGSIDTQRHILRYVVGAQLPLPIVITEDKADFLPGKGKPVGLFEDASWAVEEMTLPDNSTLLVVSDGLLDCVKGDSMEEKEQTILAVCKRVGPAGGHDAICHELGIDTIENAPDDVSVMTVTRQHG
ncbi:MAG: SpoIIE family protein phosphatase [Porticoccaceae bacterium]|nr:SpoIIE family protein phosphatase [Porticoccaceae bacterium]